MEVNHPLLNQPTKVEIVDNSNEPWVLVRCTETDFHFLLNPPEYDQLIEEFEWEKSLLDEQQRRRKEERLVYFASTIAKKIKFTLNPNRDKMFQLAFGALVDADTQCLRILDVGCGNGKKMIGFCERFRQYGVEVTPYGVEVSKVLAEKSGERFKKFGGQVFQSSAIEIVNSSPHRDFDAVTMLSFLEHEAKPLELLLAVRQILKPDGCIILKVPNFACWNRIVRGRKWAGYRYPDHVNYFTPATLELLAERAGYQLQKQTLPYRLPTNDNMYAVLQKSS